MAIQATARNAVLDQVFASPVQRTRSDRLYALDLVRFLAAAAVCWFHWFSLDTDHKSPAAGYGYLGVPLFFMISGFVILMTARGATLRSFVAARVVRLYPAFWICCTLTVCITLIVDPHMPALGWATYLANMTMFPGPIGFELVNLSYWTLLLEAKFYLLVCILILCGALGRIEWVLWAWLASIPLTSAPMMERWLMTAYAPYFVGGCACFLLRERITASRWALLLAAWASAMALAVNDTGNADRMAGVCIAATGFFLLMLAIGQDWVSLPRSRLAVAVGAMSYPLYLLHQPIGQLLLGRSERDPVMVAATAFVVLSLSWLVHVYGEKPMAAWMRRALSGKDHAQSAHAKA